ncbi:hypothetical protein J1792_04005 [Streptomyces triculaminicus]|uniref:Uncharacterized protein n=1 Tax=Streptomyces triculaminicus TaxID=2816232 RepID=A0A939JP94_9ACTN|nr:hypothetical protein [Streptomyces triculaminicus]MBO0651990.1 hypothetical protein [Streptomyces triculaminicus]
MRRRPRAAVESARWFQSGPGRRAGYLVRRAAAENGRLGLGLGVRLRLVRGWAAAWGWGWGC